MSNTSVNGVAANTSPISHLGQETQEAQESGDTIEKYDFASSENNGTKTEKSHSYSNEEQQLVSTSTSTPYQVYKRRWFGLLALIGMNIVISWGWLTFAPVSSAAQDYYNLSTKTPINWLSTVMLFTYVVASPGVVYILNRHGVKLAIQISSLLTLLGFWVRYLGTRFPSQGGNFTAVMFGQILIGFAQPFVLSSPTYYSDLWFTSRGRVSATALASLSNAFGAALPQLINPFLATKASQIPNMVLYMALIATIPSVLSLFIPSKPPKPPCASSAEKKLPLHPSLKLLCKDIEFLAIFVLFSTYLGLFNAFASLTDQFMEPYGFSTDQAGISGAVLIAVGLVVSAVVAPVVDKTHAYVIAVRTQVPVIAGSFIAFIFVTAVPNPPVLAGPMVVCALLGASSFSLLPLALEYVAERTFPVSPELTSGILWMGGELLGGIFLLIMDAMRRKNVVVRYGRRIEGDMWAALVLEGVLAAVVCPLIFFVGRGSRGNLRVEADLRGWNKQTEGADKAGEGANADSNDVVRGQGQAEA